MKVIDFVKAEIDRLSVEYKIACQRKNRLHCNLIKNRVAYLYKITEACEETGEEAFFYTENSLELFGLDSDKL